MQQFKEKALSLLLSLVAVLAPVKSTLIAVGVLIVADLITGLVASAKKKEPITSAGLRRTVTKMFVYQLAVISGFIAEKYLIGDLMPVTKIVSGMIGIVELKSIFENLNIVSGENLLKQIIEKLGSSNAPKE